MSNDVTQRLAEIEARTKAATPGPWRREGDWNDIAAIDTDGTPYGVAGNDESISHPDAEFIAHAREDVPWLIERLSRAEAELHRLAFHPDWEYATTTGQRKQWDVTPPEGDGWCPNVHRGYGNGWARFDYHEEAYWMRLRALDGGDDDQESTP